METIHPIVVHFPLALLIAAFFIETLALIFKKPEWHRISLWNLVLGSLGALAAVLTGRQAMAVAKHSFEIYQVMELHERIGYIVLGLSLVLMGWRLLGRDRLSGPSRWVAWTMLGALCALMGLGAHLGGRLVFEFGVGGSYGLR